MGLFSKKYCDICGEKIGFLGNKKLEDGNMCKNCARKLSPWFSDRRHADLASIKEQLAYREANRSRVAAFRATRVIGERVKALLDEDARRFMVTDADDLNEENPDVLDFSDVRSCILDIEHNKTELTKEDSEGNSVSYNPKRYEHTYDFNVTITVNNPYFDEIEFRLNRDELIIEASAGFGAVSSFDFNPEQDYRYRRYVDMADELKNVLMKQPQEYAGGGQPQAANAAQSALPEREATVVCPWCGSNTPSGTGNCIFCGGVL